MRLHSWHIQLHQILKKLDPQLYLALVTSVERQEMERVYEVGQTTERLA